MRTRPTSLPYARIAAVTAATLAFAALAQAQPKTFIAGSGPDELWDVTTKMEIVGMPMAMPAQTHQVCLKKDRRAEDTIPQQDDCRATDVRTSGNKVSYKMVCTGKNPMTGEGEITSGPNAYEGKLRARSTKKGEEMEFQQSFTGRKVGACTDQSQQMAAAAKSQGDAMTAKACSEGMDKLYAKYFFDKGAPCASQQKQFCDKVAGHAREMREPSGFRAVVAKAQAPTVKEAFAACNQDFDATAKAACGKAASTKDWSFVGSGSCDPEVLAVGGTQCKGRDYYTMDRTITPVCNRYAMLTRGSAGSQAASQSASNALPPAEPKPDAMKQGIDAIRKALPF